MLSGTGYETTAIIYAGLFEGDYGGEEVCDGVVLWYFIRTRRALGRILLVLDLYWN